MLISFLSKMFSSGEINFRGKHCLPGEAFFLGSKIPYENLVLVLSNDLCILWC